MNKLIIALFLFILISGCSPYLMSSQKIMPGDTRQDVIAAWGQPFTVEKSVSSRGLLEIYTYGLASVTGYGKDMRTDVFIENGIVILVNGYKSGD